MVSLKRCWLIRGTGPCSHVCFSMKTLDEVHFVHFVHCTSLYILQYLWIILRLSTKCWMPWVTYIYTNKLYLTYYLNSQLKCFMLIPLYHSHVNRTEVFCHCFSTQLSQLSHLTKALCLWHWVMQQHRPTNFLSSLADLSDSSL